MTRLLLVAVLAFGCAPADDEPFMLPLPDAGMGGVCAVGDRRACMCPSGALGEQVCADGSGAWSDCGCAVDGSVYVPPEPPETYTCPTGECDPYLEPPTDYSASGCCTLDGRCGSTNRLLMGRECVPRAGPAVVRNEACPDESITFLDLRGCCLPTGGCGLTIDETLPNWDLGCIERTEMRRVMDQGVGRKLIAALMLLDPEVPDWQPLACSP